MFLVNQEVVKQALSITWKGMLAIFIAIGIIYIAITILNSIKSKKQD